tara:strand:+ start:1194 stop:1649 length:456 start_codon:yes stop_codon:yes gene_type:complete
MNQRFKLAVLGTALPLLAGALIYVGARSTDLLMFEWMQWAGMSTVALETRSLIGPALNTAPAWIRYSLPDALWLLAYLNSVRLIWGSTFSDAARWWTGAGVALAIGHEAAQGASLIRGTFDPNDLAAYLGAIAVSAAFTHRFRPDTNTNHP